MRRTWIAGAVALGVAALPLQLAGVASSDTGASPRAGSSAPAQNAEGRERPGWAEVDTTAARVTSKVGDKDNFGYGVGTGAPPCEFYDLRETEDVGVFDYEPVSGGDENDSWTHEFDLTGTPTRVTLVVHEIFVDEGSASVIDIDGEQLDFSQGRTAICGAYGEGGVKHKFVLTGDQAAVAADGVVVVTLHENGDDIALDRARVTVKSS
jgi:hypothetical protein